MIRRITKTKLLAAAAAAGTVLIFCLVVLNFLFPLRLENRPWSTLVLAGKMTQILRAFQLEAHLSKNEILTLYLNYAPFGAAMVMNLQTLEVAAYVGSSDFASQDRNGHVDMIRAVRSPGSTLKPFLYGMALDEGLIHSHSLLMDTPRFRKEYTPGNFSRGFSGPVSMTQALRLSLNVPAVQVLEVFGAQTFHDRLINAGAALDLSGRPNLSMVLGGLGTSLESTLVLYSALARDGLTGMPRLLKSDPIQERYLMSEGAAWIISRILSQPMPGFEGISRLSGRAPMAWKTGTSYGFRNAWAFGIMGEYVAGVWVGRPDGTPCPGQYGAVTAIPLLQRVFESLPMSDFRKKRPGSVTLEPICWPPGTLTSQTKGDCDVTHDAWILDHQVPLTLNPDDAPAATLSHTFWLDAHGRRHWFLNAEPIAVLPAGSTGTVPLPPPGAYQLAVADDKGHVDMVHFTIMSLN